MRCLVMIEMRTIASYRIHEAANLSIHCVRDETSFIYRKKCIKMFLKLNVFHRKLRRSFRGEVNYTLVICRDASLYCTTCGNILSIGQ